MGKGWKIIIIKRLLDGFQETETLTNKSCIIPAIALKGIYLNGLWEILYKPFTAFTGMQLSTCSESGDRLSKSLS